MMDEAIVVAFQRLQGLRYAELCSTMIIVYEHLITFGEEVDLVWKSGWSAGKCLYLLNRYYALGSIIFNNICLHWFQWQAATGIIAFTLAELIMQLRLYAMWFLDKRIMAFMFCFFLAAVAASSTLMGIVMSRVKGSSHFVPGFPFCVPLNLQGPFYALWIPMLASETLLCGLALWRGVRSYYRKRDLFRSGPSLIHVLIRDSIAYFLVLFAVYLTNAILFAIGDPYLIESGIGYTIAMSCVMSNRLCLNVRGMVHNNPEEDDHIEITFSIQTGHQVSSDIISPITFAPRQHGSFGRADRCHRVVNVGHGSLAEVNDVESTEDVDLGLNGYEMDVLRELKVGS